MSNISLRALFNKITVDGNTEFDYLDNNLIEMELPTVDTIVIGEGFAGRPDLVSYKAYGNFDFGTLIAWHNGMDDPISGMKVGTIVNIPSLEEFYRYVNRNRKNR